MTTPKHVKARVALNPKLNPNGKGGGSVATYRSEYCDMLVSHMSQGYSFGSFGAVTGNGSRTLHEWAEVYPEFGEAKRKGHEAAKQYYEKLANIKMRGQKVGDIDPKRMDTALIIFFLKTRFRDDYSEKMLLEHSGNVGASFVFEEKSESDKNTDV